MRILVCMGMAYRVWERDYRQVLVEIRDTGGVDIEKYGRRLGPVMNITDMTQSEASDRLGELKAERTKTSTERI